MISIVFESHSTTTDNATGRASGWADVELSELGEQQAKDLGRRRGGEHFDAIFCSDLQRSYRTAELAFGNKFPIYKDARLRECSYGDMDGKPTELVNPEKKNRISQPFPNGESYEQTCERMQSFLDELARNYQGKHVLIIGHRATQYGLEHSLNGLSVVDAVTAPWQYQPGWEYQLT